MSRTEVLILVRTTGLKDSFKQEPEFTISDLLAQGEEYRLYQLTKFYRDRLIQAIEEKVERLGWMLTKEGHFSRDENEKVTELTEKGNRAESSRLFLSLVNGKGSRARRAMWESFLMWRTELPKLDRILREIQELGPDPQEYMNIGQGLSELPTQLIDVQQKHKETLRAQTETLGVNTILMTEKVKVFQLADRYAELTVISTVRDRTLVEHELLARGRDHEEYREKQLRRQLEKIRTDQLFQSSFSRSKSKSGSSAAVAGVPGIGKTTMVQKIVYDWAMGKIYQQFQFVFSFKFRDLNSIDCRIKLKELILIHLKRRWDCSPKRAENADEGESQKWVGIRVGVVSNPESPDVATCPVVAGVVVHEASAGPVCTPETDLEPSTQDLAESASLEANGLCQSPSLPTGHNCTCCVELQLPVDRIRDLRLLLDDLGLVRESEEVTPERP
ncbi:uncharacterized protein LOC132388543 [Hypanus sabinus]|uniref:uncharacterized protein LOC132388543 n=1 Tax=Hypanus sabinus TaxID=79690 RepID=UPI0028C3BA52|nr:uncharacterized protein LOC132388543 [Hypanus sabinus]